MKKIRNMLLLSIAISGLIILSSCSTINRLDEYDLTDSRISLDLKAPPEPTVDVDYHHDYYGEGNPNAEMLNIIQLGANLIKAGEAENAEKKLYKALDGLYIPEFIAELTFDRLVNTLDAVAVEKISDSDVVLEIDIHEYGIETWSGGGHVTMIIQMEARLFHKPSRQVVWQRWVEASEELSPGVFGANNILGNVVTIASLSSLTEEQLSEGFKELTIEIMKDTIGLLQDDLREARRR